MFIAVNSSTNRYYVHEKLDTPCIQKAKKFKTYRDARDEVPKNFIIRTIKQEDTFGH